MALSLRQHKRQILGVTVSEGIATWCAMEAIGEIATVVATGSKPALPGWADGEFVFFDRRAANVANSLKIGRGAS